MCAQQSVRARSERDAAVGRIGKIFQQVGWHKEIELVTFQYVGNRGHPLAGPVSIGKVTFSVTAQVVCYVTKQ